MAKDYVVIKGQANIIRNETAEGGNTAAEVGGAIYDVADKLEEVDGVLTAALGDKLPTSSVVDNLASTSAAAPLSANQGKVLNETKSDKTTQVVAGNGLTGGGALSGDVTVNVGNTDDSIVVGADGIKVDTQDSLTSTSTTKPLSAAQGKALQDNKVDTSRTITAGNGLTGGGDLSADRTINIVNADDSLVVAADSVKVNTNNTLTSTSTTQPLSAAQGKALQDNKAEKTRTITAGNGMTGGGDLTADRTININPADDSLTVTADNVKVNTNNTLTSTSTTQPLSANQGKVLNDKVVQVKTDLNEAITALEQEQIQGGVYDVSSHNDGAVFESLSTLLGSANLNTLIPTSVRRGGMSIRFIQGTVPNSDNKYVQCRLMSDTFNTTVANWQGVDDTPTPGSNNMVKSGGVAETIGTEIVNISWSEKKQNLDLVPTLISGQKYYLKINSVSTDTRVSINVAYNGSNIQYIGNVTVGGNGIEIIPDGNKNQVIATIVDAESGSIDYSISHFGIYQELDNKLFEAEKKINDNQIAIEALSSSLTSYEGINDNKVNTISAEQDYVIKTVQTQAGTNVAIDIPISIPKGEICLVKANWGDNINATSVAIKLNEPSSVAVYATKGQWTLIKPTVNVIKFHADIDRTFVVDTGEFSLKIKKLQSITADGKLPLYDGGLSSNGSIFANANRKTTRVILNDAPLYLYLSEGYRAAYMYGNEPDNLTDGGYITALNGGGETILNVDAKYIGFTIVNPSAATFYNLRFIVANADSNDAKLGKTLNIIDSNTDLYPFIQGTRGTNGVITTQSNRITSKIIDFSGTIVIEKDVNDASFIAMYKAKGADSWTEIATWAQRLEYTGDGQLFINIAANNRDITPADAAGFGINYFIKNTLVEIKDYPQYDFSVIGQGINANYFDEPDIILRKNRRYKITFDGVLATNAQSGEILNISALNVDNPDEYISIAYRTADNTTIPTTKYISTPYDCFIRQISNLTKDSYLNIKIGEEPTSIEKAVNQATPDADKINLLINNLKCKQFLEGDLITEVSDLLVFGAGISIDSGGEFYVGIVWAENAAGEYSEPQYNVGLIIGNVLDPYGTKQRYVVAHYGDVIVDSVAYDAISGEAIAKKINSNEVAAFCAGYYLNGNSTAATRIFNLSTKTFGDFQKCYLNVVSGGTTHRFQMRNNESDMRQIHQLTGMHNWDDVAGICSNNYGYYGSNNPIKIGDYFYVFMDIGNYAPALIRTQDFIDFYFVCELPFGKTIDGNFVYNPTEEVALAYMNNRLYASCRGNKGRFAGVTEGVDYYGYNQIMSANFDDILAGTAQWDSVDLEPYWYEKPSMVAWNNQIYLITGARGTWSYKGIEGKNLNRFKHMFFIFDRNLNILKKELTNPDDGWLHPTFEKYNNSVYSVNHTDVRNYSYDGTGNNRSELKLKRLDMQLLGM